MNDSLIQRINEAHGGFIRWQQVESVQLNINIFGPILITKFKSPWLPNITANIYTDKPYVSFHNFPEAGMTSIFDGFDVYIYNQNDKIISERNFQNKDQLISKPRLRWDHEDLVHFLGYALWSYICTPFIFNNEQFSCSEGDEWIKKDGSKLNTLNVRFPSSIPCHSREQVFYYNQQGLLERNDYTADVFSPLARGAHYCSEHKTIDGFVFPTKRSVFPRLWNGSTLKPFKVMDGYIKNININWRSAAC